jgi:DNA-directed RNA polymerase subunit RPC12/RpoP
MISSVAIQMNQMTGGGKKVIHCPYCRDNARIRRSHRRNLFERIISLFGRFPYRCGECGNRFTLWNRQLGRG